MATILVVEDDEYVRENINEILSSSNYICLTANDGDKALQLIYQNKIDLILSDIMMPVMDGLTLYKKIIEKEKYWYIPFIFLTAKCEDEDLRKGMLLGADDYIKKPFEINELLNVVEVRLKKSRVDKRRIEKIKSNISKYIPHELRTPIGVIIGYSNLIREDKDEMRKDDIVAMVEWIEKSGVRLKDRIEKLILLTEIELDLDANIKNYETIEIDQTLISDMILTTSGYYERTKDIVLEIEHAKVKTPLNYIDRLVYELLDNACKFSDKGTQIEIKGKKVDGAYSLKITDHGIGMDAEEINNYEVFEQYARESRQQEGNGLGLTIVKQVVELIHGDVSIKSKKGSFTDITVQFPESRE